MAGGFSLSVQDGVAVIDWRAEGRRLNLLDLDEIASLESAVEHAVRDPAARGIVIGTSRSDLGGGVDLSLLESVARGDGAVQSAYALASRLHKLFRRVETCGKPVAAATPGTAVGGVYELMLACHRRFAAPNPAARIGLPEIRVGLFPGAGGTTRLTRMLGLRKCGPLLLEGRVLPPLQAAEAGLIDEIAPDPMASAIVWARIAAPEDAVQPWDRPGFRIPGGGPYSKNGFDAFAGAAAIVQTRMRGNYPAADALLQAAYEGSLTSFDAALEIEARHAARLIASPQTHAMIRTNFLSRQRLRAGARRPAGVAPAPLNRLGVIGAGMMGAGIAYVAAKAGISVSLIERSPEAAERGLQIIRQRATQAASRGRLGGEEAERLAGRVQAGTDYGVLEGSDLVIEAVFEDPSLKASVLARAEAAAGDGAFLASNTSTLPISDLAKALPRPDRFLGIHFFSPVERMDLVEVIRGARTGDDAVGRALDLVSAIRKTPIIVRDARFFYANRCIIPYTLETAGLLVEGVAPARIEQAALGAGMPLGCLQLIDETSIELGVQILEASRRALGNLHQQHPGEEVFVRMAVQEHRLGRKAGAGFYDYKDGRRTRLWHGLSRIWPASKPQPDVSRLSERLLAIQAVEAVRALEDGVLEDIREGDVGAVLGWGFAPWSGGPFSWLDGMGTSQACRILQRLAECHGERFAPPPILKRLARSGTSFYAHFEGRQNQDALEALP